MADTFNALLLREEGGKPVAGIEELADADLPQGDVTVRIDYSTLNYKDGMVLKGIGRLVRQYPHVPGIDFAGTVESSTSPAWKPGDKVVLNGWRVGEASWGGYAQKARVKAEWLTALPAAFATKDAMALGTAGYTAMLAINALEDHGLTPGGGEVLITGAGGGVGTVATLVLAKLGYKVAASTGRTDTHDYLKGLGAAVIVPRAELEAKPAGPLQPERWAAAIDNVAGPILANVLTQMKRNASVASVGLAASNKLETTVIPFLLRGVNILGIDSSAASQARRTRAWERLVQDLDPQRLAAATETVPLSAILPYADKILAGQVQGRVVVDVNR